jgi:hypothetical protein
MWKALFFMFAIVATGDLPSTGTGGFGWILTVQNPSDIQLQAAVSQAMQTSPLTAKSHIVVHVAQGEVTLEGAATSALALREATRLAETVLGVRQVHNRLSVINQQTAETSPHE